MDQKIFDQGMSIRREVLGGEYVDNAIGCVVRAPVVPLPCSDSTRASAEDKGMSEAAAPAAKN